MFRIGLIASALAAGALLAPAAAVAAPSAGFSLTVIGPEGKKVTVECEPPGGTHPLASKVCIQLFEAKGSIADIPPLTAGCPGIWDPVAVGVIGVWDGQPLEFSDVVSNAGCARISHGHVFNF